MFRIDVTSEPHEMNGQPGAILRDRDGRVLNTVTLDVIDVIDGLDGLDGLDGQIQMIRLVIKPDKLGHLGPVPDPRAVDREVRQARRQPRDCRTGHGPPGRSLNRRARNTSSSSKRRSGSSISSPHSSRIWRSR